MHKFEIYQNVEPAGLAGFFYGKRQHKLEREHLKTCKGEPYTVFIYRGWFHPVGHMLKVYYRSQPQDAKRAVIEGDFLFGQNFVETKLDLKMHGYLFHQPGMLLDFLPNRNYFVGEGLEKLMLAYRLEFYGPVEGRSWPHEVPVTLDEMFHMFGSYFGDYIMSAYHDPQIMEEVLEDAQADGLIKSDGSVVGFQYKGKDSLDPLRWKVIEALKKWNFKHALWGAYDDYSDSDSGDIPEELENAFVMVVNSIVYRYLVKFFKGKRYTFDTYGFESLCITDNKTGESCQIFFCVEEYEEFMKYGGCEGYDSDISVIFSVV